MANIPIAAIDDVQTISLIHALSWKEVYKNTFSQEFLSSIQNDRWVPFETKVSIAHWQVSCRL